MVVQWWQVRNDMPFDDPNIPSSDDLESILEPVAKSKPVRPLANPASSITSNRERFIPPGADKWSINDFDKIDSRYRQQFGSAIPTAAYGQGRIHNSQGWDHRNAVDVPVDPNSDRGKWILNDLRTNGVPFQAMYRAIKNPTTGRISSTGPHIHVGLPSHSINQTFPVGTRATRTSAAPTQPLSFYTTTASALAPDTDLESLLEPIGNALAVAPASSVVAPNVPTQPVVAQPNAAPSQDATGGAPRFGGLLSAITGSVGTGQGDTPNLIESDITRRLERTQPQTKPLLKAGRNLKQTVRPLVPKAPGVNANDVNYWLGISPGDFAQMTKDGQQKALAVAANLHAVDLRRHANNIALQPKPTADQQTEYRANAGFGASPGPVNPLSGQPTPMRQITGAVTNRAPVNISRGSLIDQQTPMAGIARQVIRNPANRQLPANQRGVLRAGIPVPPNPVSPETEQSVATATGVPVEQLRQASQTATNVRRGFDESSADLISNPDVLAKIQNTIAEQQRLDAMRVVRTPAEIAANENATQNLVDSTNSRGVSEAAFETGSSLLNQAAGVLHILNIGPDMPLKLATTKKLEDYLASRGLLLDDAVAAAQEMSPKDAVDNATKLAGELGLNLPIVAGESALVGPYAAFGGPAALETLGRGGSYGQAIKQGATGVAQAGLFEATGGLPLKARVPTVGLGTAGIDVVTGKPVTAQNELTNMAFSAFGGKADERAPAERTGKESLQVEPTGNAGELPPKSLSEIPPGRSTPPVEPQLVQKVTPKTAPITEQNTPLDKNVPPDVRESVQQPVALARPSSAPVQAAPDAELESLLEPAEPKTSPVAPREVIAKSRKEVAAKAKIEKVNARTGLTLTQRDYVAGQLVQNYDRLRVQNADLDEVGRKPPLEIKVPGDGEFVVPTKEGANKLHQKITGEPIPGQERVSDATIPTPKSLLTQTPKGKPTAATQAKIDTEQEILGGLRAKGENAQDYNTSEYLTPDRVSEVALQNQHSRAEALGAKRRAERIEREYRVKLENQVSTTDTKTLVAQEKDLTGAKSLTDSQKTRLEITQTELAKRGAANPVIKRPTLPAKGKPVVREPAPEPTAEVIAPAPKSDFRVGDRVRDANGRKGTVFADKQGNLAIEQDGTKARIALNDKWTPYGKRGVESVNGLNEGDVVSKQRKGETITGKVYARNGRLRVKFTQDFKTNSEPLNEKWEKAKNTEAGAVSSDLLTLGLARTVKDDVTPAARKAGETLTSSADDVAKLVLPQARGAGGRFGGGLLRKELADSARSFEVAIHALKEARRYFDKNPVQDNHEFIRQMEGGDISKLPASEQPMAKTLRGLLDNARKQVQDLGTGKLEHFIENYFPHIWEQEGDASKVFKRVFGKKPFEGPKSFLKKRTLETFQDGLDAGLKPVSDNPVDLALLKIKEMQRYIAAHKVLNAGKDEGYVKFVKIGDKPPDGFTKINDRIAEVNSMNPDGELVKRGSYYADDGFARIINNHLSPGLRDRSSAYRAWLAAGNALNQAQLGVSAFHLGFTTMDAMTSKLALAINQGASGHPIQAAKSILETPISPITNIIRGDRVMREGLAPGTADPVNQAIANLVVEGGGRFKQDDFYQTRMTEKMFQAFKRGNILGGVLRAPFAAVETAARPIMNYIVPRQKLGVFADLAKHEIARMGPNVTPAQIREAMGKVWDTVDNRMGQMVYDNLFWNHVVKDLAMGSVRSVGWNIGTWRELGGGVKDIATVPLRIKQVIKGEPMTSAVVTPRMAYLAALPIMAGVVGAVLNYLFTGQRPKDLKDYYFPRTGNLDENGKPERVSLPSYMKDVIPLISGARQGGVSGLGRAAVTEASHKMHPLIGLIADTLANKDYYGDKIRNEDDPLVQQIWDVAKHAGDTATPFAIKGLLKEKQRGGSVLKQVLPFIGLTPAPANVNNTDAEDLLHEINGERTPANARTKEQAERANLIRQLAREKKLGHQIDDQITKGINAGILSTKDRKTINDRASKDYLTAGVSRLPLADALRVYEVATDEEKAKLKQIVRRKLSSPSTPLADRDKERAIKLGLVDAKDFNARSSVIKRPPPPLPRPVIRRPSGP